MSFFIFATFLYFFILFHNLYYIFKEVNNTKKYRISENTLAIIPMGDNNSLIYEVDKMLVINNKPNNIIKLNCILDGSSYQIRVDYSRNITGNMYKSPIVLNNNIIFFPTCSPRLKEVSWLNIKSINKLSINKDNKSSIIELINGNQLYFKESLWTLNNQILKASRFEFLLRKKDA